MPEAAVMMGVPTFYTQLLAILHSAGNTAACV